MISINLKGGLGNQLFQYACGRALSVQNKDSLQLTRKGCSSEIPRPLSLINFNIKGEIIPFEQISSWQKFKSYVEQKLLRRFYVGFDSRVLEKQGDIYLDGYFQSEKYFENIANLIREEFILKTPLGESAFKMMATIMNDERSVSIHVRRGDYPTHPDLGGIADQAYFERAITYIRNINPNSRFYFFSDDIEWCRANLSTISGENIFVSEPDMRDYEELILMSACRHNIISNSSFSWWGAWLNTNPKKVVVVPSRWSNGHEQEWYQDIVPAGWLRL